MTEQNKGHIPGQEVEQGAAGSALERFVGPLPALPGKTADLQGFSLLNAFLRAPEDMDAIGQLRGVIRAGRSAVLARELARHTFDPGDIEAYADAARTVRDPKRRSEHLIEVGGLIDTRRRLERGDSFINPESIQAKIYKSGDASTTDLERTDEQLLVDIRSAVADLAADERPEDALSVAKKLHKLTGDPDDMARLIECIFDLDDPRQSVNEVLELPFDPYINLIVFRILREGNYVSQGRGLTYTGHGSKFMRNDFSLPAPDTFSAMPDDQRQEVADEDLRAKMAQTLIEHFVGRSMFGEKNGVEKMLEQIATFPFPLPDAIKRLDFAKNAIPWIVKQRENREVDTGAEYDSNLLKQYTLAALHLAGKVEDEEQRELLVDEARWMIDDTGKANSQDVVVAETNFLERGIAIADFTNAPQDVNLLLSKEYKSNEANSMIIAYLTQKFNDQAIPTETQPRALTLLRTSTEILLKHEFFRTEPYFIASFYKEHLETLIDGFLTLYDDSQNDADLDRALKLSVRKIRTYLDGSRRSGMFTTPSSVEMNRFFFLTSADAENSSGPLSVLNNDEQAIYIFTDDAINIEDRKQLVRIWSRQFPSDEAKAKLGNLIGSLAEAEKAELMSAIDREVSRDSAQVDRDLGIF